ncbi:hypothetical protein BDW22DRAFT_1415622 [Trametopsis cervina]|nr:hypothetical protein BDW22DRAFT_1415622 [Trametopsis cervina]
MSFMQDSEQVRHDRVNLVRLVRRLDRTVGSKEWEDEMRSPTRATWVKTQGMLQKLKFARKLLKTVELHHALEDSSASTRLDEYEDTIAKLETVVNEAHKKVAHQPRRPPPILPTLPLPVLVAPSIASEQAQTTVTEVLPQHDPGLPLSESLPTLGAMLPESSLPQSRPPIDPAASLLPASAPSSTEKSTLPTGTPAFLQNSAALQEEMSQQLVQMAQQLKRNAVHFASSLNDDKAVVELAQQKMERNFDVLTKERVRLRDHRSKSWGTTWLVVLSLFVAAVGFVLTFLVIRIT